MSTGASSLKESEHAGPCRSMVRRLERTINTRKELTRISHPRAVMNGGLRDHGVSYTDYLLITQKLYLA